MVTTEPHRAQPEAKTINYIPGITSQLKANRRNPQAIEAIYLADGLVSEGTRSNTFIHTDDRWITPADGMLLGITRAEVIKLLAADGLLELRDISLDEYYSADEIILTSSTKEVAPVVKVDDVTIGDGAPGAYDEAPHASVAGNDRRLCGRRHRSLRIFVHLLPKSLASHNVAHTKYDALGCARTGEPVARPLVVFSVHPRK